MTKKTKQKDDLLLEAADELNKLFFEDEESEGFIDPELETEELKKAIVKAAELLDKDEGDELSDDTIEVLQGLYADIKVTNKKLAKNLRAFNILPTEKEEPEDAEEVEAEEVKENGDNLVDQIEEAEKMSELKDIAKANDVFKQFRGTLSKYKTTEKLRGAMLEVLEPAPEETEPEEAPKKKSGTKKKSKTSSNKTEKTELGHAVDSQAGSIDKQFLKNKGKKVKLSSIVEATGLSKARIKSHVYHLSKKGLNISTEKTKDDIIYKYNK